MSTNDISESYHDVSRIVGKPARIAYVADEIADYRIDWLTGLATELREAARVVLVVGSTTSIRQSDLDAFMAVGELELVGHGKKFTRRDREGVPLTSLHLNGRLLNTLLRRRFDVLISEGYGRSSLYVLTARLLVGSKMVTSWERTAWTDRANSNARNAYYRLASPFTDLYFANGKQSAQWIGQRLSRRAIVSPNYTCHRDFFAVPDAQDSGRAAPIRVLICSRLVVPKGLSQFFEAARHHGALDQFEFHLVGSGPLREHLERLTAAAPQLQLILHGQRDRSYVLDLMARTDLVMLPTLEDNWSLAIAEGVAAGRPVATTPYNGLVGDVARSGVNAFIFDPLEQKSVLGFLDEVLGRRSELTKMGQASRVIASGFHPDRVAEKMAPWLHRLANTSRREWLATATGPHYVSSDG